MVTVGGRRRQWSFPVLCSRCRVPVTDGFTNPLDDADPPRNALCRLCYGFIMNLGEGDRDPMPADN